MRSVERALAFAANPPLSTKPGPDYCYTPCDTGLHVCGHHPDGVNCLTIVNLPCRDEAEARALWATVKTECERSGDEPDDYLVDLNIRLWGDGGHEDDFSISRQMLPRVIQMWADAPSGVTATDTGRNT